MHDNCFMFKGYPGNYKKGKNINFKNFKDNKNLFIFHAGTKQDKALSNKKKYENCVRKRVQGRKISFTNSSTTRP